MRRESEELLLAIARVLPFAGHCSGSDISKLKEARAALEAAMAADAPAPAEPTGPREVHHAGNGDLARTMDALDPHAYDAGDPEGDCNVWRIVRPLTEAGPNLAEAVARAPELVVCRHCGDVLNPELVGAPGLVERQSDCLRCPEGRATRAVARRVAASDGRQAVQAGPRALEAGWESMKAACALADATQVQLDEMRMAFFGGARCALSLAGGSGPKALSLEAELGQFLADFELRRCRGGRSDG